MLQTPGLTTTKKTQAKPKTQKTQNKTQRHSKVLLPPTQKSMHLSSEFGDRRKKENITDSFDADLRVVLFYFIEVGWLGFFWLSGFDL